MVNIEEFKLSHKDELLQHSFHDLEVLFGKFDYESQYTIMQMEHYLDDIKHVIEQKMDVSIISHLTYNLNIQLLHCYNHTKDYYDASRLYLLGDHGVNIQERIKDYQKKEKEIKDLVNTFNEINLFEIHCAHPADFLAAEHYRRGIEDKNKPLLNLERQLSFMNGVQLLKCLIYLLDLTEGKLLDIRNGITFEPKETLEFVYDLNCVYYADNYWEDDLKNFRIVISNELMDEVTPQGLHGCYQHLLYDFKTNELGAIWVDNAASISDLTYELKLKNLTYSQWEYYFKTIFQLEELKRWKDELKKATGSSKTRSKIRQVERQKTRETMTFKSGKNVLEGHLTLFFRKLVKDGWIEGNEADFKALFSGKRDEDCVLTWSGKYGKANLVKLIMELDKAGLIVVPKGYAITPILEGHFKDNSGQWLSGLDKMNTPSTKALTVIHECIKLLKTEPRRLMDGDYQDNEDFQSIYDPYDHQDLQLHQR